MKELIVVSKTHLDMGFTDYAGKIYTKYITEFIPSAIGLAEKMNTGAEKNFVWTTGSWILLEALHDKDAERRNRLVEAIRRGDIAPHAMPFTTHTELIDEDSLDYGLSLVDEIDKITGTKTVSAKMTDVPGHTIGLVHVLAKHGIKMLHIGVNGASAMPDVPECFLWKSGDSEVIVVYSGCYGDEFKCSYIDDILYFDHSVDNRGTKSESDIEKTLTRLRKQYPDYEVKAGRMDEYAELIWAAKDKLPVITSEIGDTWIHGSAADPFKSAGARELISCKENWLADGTLERDSDEYKALCNGILCVCEHTCGLDMKMYLADYENYLRRDFERARKKDKVVLRHPFREYPMNYNTIKYRKAGVYKQGSYKAMEASWQEQRDYITDVLNYLTQEHKAELSERLNALIPKEEPEIQGAELVIDKIYNFGSKKLSINRYGGIASYYDGETNVIMQNDKPAVLYRSYGKEDYDFWLTHYTRDYEETISWCVGDFARPLIKYCDKGYRHGTAYYTVKKSCVDNTGITVCLSAEDYWNQKLGAPNRVYINYIITDVGIKIELEWFGKPANRLTESTSFCFFPNMDKSSLSYNKISTPVNPYDVVENGSRALSAVQSVDFSAQGKEYKIVNVHSPVVSLGKTDILHFDNSFSDVETKGLSFVLHNNVWGTNFPLWYEENARFDFEIIRKEV